MTLDTEVIDWSLVSDPVVFPFGPPQPGTASRVRVIPRLWIGDPDEMLPADVFMCVKRIAIEPLIAAEDAARWRCCRDFFQWGQARMVIFNKIYVDCTLFKLQHSGGEIAIPLLIPPQTPYHFELLYQHGPLLHRPLKLRVELMGTLRRPVQ